MIGAAVDEPELERPALRLGQRVDRAPHGRQRDVVGRRLLARVRETLDEPVAYRHGWLATSGDVGADVDEDRVEPRTQAPVARVPEAVQCEERPEQRLLDGILGVLGIAKPVTGGREKGRVVGPDDLVERFSVAAAVRGDESDRSGLLDGPDIRRR